MLKRNKQKLLIVTPVIQPEYPGDVRPPLRPQQLHHLGSVPGLPHLAHRPNMIGDPQDLAGRPGPVWDHVIVCDKGHPISFRTLGAGVKINRFPNTAAVCRKDRLWANYTAMQKKHGKKSFNFIPKVISFNISHKLCNPPCRLTNFPRRKRFSSGK